VDLRYNNSYSKHIKKPFSIDNYKRGLKMKDKKKSVDKGEGFFIPGGILLGMGVGFLYNNLVAYMFMGLGIGFLLAGIVRLIRNR
jgi:hypothetical protein